MSIGRTIATGSDLHGQRLERLTHDHKIQRSAPLHSLETMPSLLIGPFLVSTSEDNRSAYYWPLR